MSTVVILIHVVNPTTRTSHSCRKSCNGILYVWYGILFCVLNMSGGRMRRRQHLATPSGMGTGVGTPQVSISITVASVLLIVSVSV